MTDFDDNSDYESIPGDQEDYQNLGDIAPANGKQLENGASAMANNERRTSSDQDAEYYNETEFPPNTRAPPPPSSRSPAGGVNVRRNPSTRSNRSSGFHSGDSIASSGSSSGTVFNGQLWTVAKQTSSSPVNKSQQEVYEFPDDDDEDGNYENDFLSGNTRSAITKPLPPTPVASEQKVFSFGRRGPSSSVDEAVNTVVIRKTISSLRPAIPNQKQTTSAAKTSGPSSLHSLPIDALLRNDDDLSPSNAFQRFGIVKKTTLPPTTSSTTSSSNLTSPLAQSAIGVSPWTHSPALNATKPAPSLPSSSEPSSTPQGKPAPPNPNKSATTPPAFPVVRKPTPLWQISPGKLPNATSEPTGASWRTTKSAANSNSANSTASTSPAVAFPVGSRSASESDVPTSQALKQQHWSTASTPSSGSKCSVGASNGLGKSFAKSDNQLAVDVNDGNSKLPSKTPLAKVDVPTVPAWRRNQLSVAVQTKNGQKEAPIPGLSATSTPKWKSVANRSLDASERVEETTSAATNRSTEKESMGVDKNLKENTPSWRNGVGGRAVGGKGETAKAGGSSAVKSAILSFGPTRQNGETSARPKTLQFGVTQVRQAVDDDQSSPYEELPPEPVSPPKWVKPSAPFSDKKTPFKPSAKETATSDGPPPPPPRRSDSDPSSSLSSRNSRVTRSQIPCEYEPLPESDNDSMLSKYAWYFGELDRQQSEDLLRPMLNKDGAFLLRRRTNVTVNSPYCISAVSKRRIVQLLVRQRPDGLYACGTEKANEKKFTSVPELINFYKHNSSLVIDESILLTLTDSPPKR